MRDAVVLHGGREAQQHLAPVVFEVQHPHLAGLMHLLAQ